MVVDVVQRLIDFRDERLADGISLEAQYSSLRDPGRKPCETCKTNSKGRCRRLWLQQRRHVLAQLLALNKSIAEQEKDGLTEPRRPGNGGLPGTKLTTSRIEAPIRL